MTENNIEQRVTEVLRQTCCGNLPQKVNRELTLAQLDWDSLDVAEAIMELEEEFNISISDDTFHSWNTVGDIVTFVEKQKS